MDWLMLTYLGVGGTLLAVVIVALVGLSLRVVVPTNEVHIVQSAKSTISYGKDQAAGNTYYRFPANLPGIGVIVSVLPMSVFSISLENYAAYDKGRVPFIIDIMAFFRVTDSNVAAQRVSSIKELDAQLRGILQGVCRTILATSEIESILEGRAMFGEMFTKEVDHNLTQWGIQSVKQIELMDIRDQQGGKVIDNIMAKKKSFIEMESRTAVASNRRAGDIAEIENNQATLIRQQEAQELVAVRTAARNKVSGIADQEARQAVEVASQVATQAVKEQEAITADKNMSVLKVTTVRQAEITRDQTLVIADQAKRVRIIEAEAQKEATVTIADGELGKARLNAAGIQAEGEAKGAAETAVLMAPVNAQTALAKEIGANKEYQHYLVTVRTIEKDEAIGVAQADALKAANIKVIANSGSVTGGINKITDLLSSEGGTAVGSMLEGLAQTPTGEALIKRVVNGNGKHVGDEPHA